MFYYNWITATETNNMGFSIDRTVISNLYTGRQAEERHHTWETIGFVNGNGTTTEIKSYSFLDEGLSSGKYQYRLKQIDFDGSFKFLLTGQDGSDIVEVEIVNPAEFILEQNYPNPFNPTTLIRFSVPNVTLSGVEGSRVQLRVFDVLGNEVETLVNENKSAGNYVVEFKANDLSSGVYFYKLNFGNTEAVKKMVLMR